MKQYFTKIPHSIYEAELDPISFYIWCAVRKFPKGNGSTNKMLAKQIGISPRTISDRLTILKEKGLLEERWIPNQWGKQRFLKAISPDEIANKKLSYQEFFEAEKEKLEKRIKMPINNTHKEAIKNKYKKYLTEHD